MKKILLFWIFLIGLAPLALCLEWGWSVSLYPVIQGGKGGYINKMGQIVIDPQYHEAGPFLQDFAAVKSGNF